MKGGGREFFSKEIRLMDMIILIKSLGFKYTVEERKFLNDPGNHLENKCNLLRLVANKSMLQPKFVEQGATYGTARCCFHYKGMCYLIMFTCTSCNYFRLHRLKENNYLKIDSIKYGRNISGHFMILKLHKVSLFYL